MTDLHVSLLKTKIVDLYVEKFISCYLIENAPRTILS